MKALIVKTLSSLRGKVIKYKHRYYLVGGFKIVNCGGLLGGKTIVIFTNRQSIILDFKGFDSFNNSLNVVENYSFSSDKINHSIPIKSEYRGVTWHKIALKWQASAYLCGKHTYIGLYDCEHEAYSDILKAEKECNLIKK